MNSLYPSTETFTAKPLQSKKKNRLNVSSFINHMISDVFFRELKHRAVQHPNEPKFKIHEYIEARKEKSGCCSYF